MRRNRGCVAETSTDSALTWQPIPAPTEDCQTVFMTADAAVFAYEVVFSDAAAEPTMTYQLRQADGDRWSGPRPLPAAIVSSTFLGGDGVIYMAGMSDTGASTIWRSLDEGRSWESIYGPIEGYVVLVATKVLGVDLIATLPLAGQTLLFKVEADGWGWSAAYDPACPTGRDTTVLAGADRAYSVTVTPGSDEPTFCRSADGLRWTPVTADELPPAMNCVDMWAWTTHRQPVIFLDDGDALLVTPSMTWRQLDGLSFLPGDPDQERISLSSDPTWLEYVVPR